MAGKGPPQWRIGPDAGASRIPRGIRRRPVGTPLLAALLFASACGGTEGDAADVPAAAEHAPEATRTPPAGDPRTALVRPGLEVLLADSLHLVRGRRVGLITNHTGVARDGRSGIDLLHGHPDVELAALFAPEHGIRGALPEGVLVDPEVDPDTGIPIHSLYDGTRSPTPEELEALDVLLFDVQDVGARYYTYVSNMTLAMAAAAERGVTFVVLDRPNPIGGLRVQGNILNPAFSSFMGMHPVPMRHGMTVGELAILYRDTFGVGSGDDGHSLDLRIVPADGWEREMSFDETGLPWVAPSPNMVTLLTALHYPGTCLFEGTGLSVGRGTDRPFEQIGAPWIAAEALAATLNERRRELSSMGMTGLADVRFEPVSFTPRNPTDGKYDGVEVHGVRFVATGPEYDPTVAAVHALVATREMAREAGGDPEPGGNQGAARGPEPWTWRADHFDLLAGTDRLRIAIEEGWEALEITARWEEDLAFFLPLREAALIY